MWTFVLTDRAGAPLGELRDATARALRLPLNRLPTLSFTVRVDNPMAEHLVKQDLTLVKGYDDSTGTKTLRFIGPVVSSEKSRGREGGSVAVTAAGPAWRLGHRLLGKNPAGATFGTAVSTIDRGEIAGQILDALNNGNASTVHTDAADTGIRRGTITASALSYAGPWRYKQADEAISELSAALDGFDWEIAPVEPTADTIGVQIGSLNAAPILGQTQTNSVFEFGTGRHNVEDWRDIGDSSGLANRGHNLPPGFPDNATQQVVTSDDTVSIGERGLHETVIPGDLVVDTLRQQLVTEHIRIRKVPRRVITFSPIAEDSTAPASERRVPVLFVDYNVGDIVPFRAVERFAARDAAGAVTNYTEVKTVDALFRIYAIDLRIDDAGVATAVPTLVAES